MLFSDNIHSIIAAKFSLAFGRPRFSQMLRLPVRILIINKIHVILSKLKFLNKYFFNIRVS